MFTVGLGLSNHTDVVMPYLVRFGTTAQKERWLPKVCAWRIDWVRGYDRTRHGLGHRRDCHASRSRRDDYILNGSKVFISNGINSDIVIVVCKTGAGEIPQRNISLLVVEAGTPGFERGRNLPKIGQHAADTAELFFDDARVPADALLGEEGRGFYHLMTMLPQERLSIAVAALSHAEAAFDRTLDYCKARQAFGQPIGSFQNLRFALATMRTELDIARVYVDAQLVAHGEERLTAEEAAEAKWWCSDLNSRVLDACLQLHGGYGYMEECSIGRAWKDGRAMSIYGGTNEIMKDIIGRRMLGV